MNDDAPRRRRIWITMARRLGAKGFEIGLVEADEMGPAPDGTLFWNWDPGKRSGSRHAVLFLGTGCCRICREFLCDDDCDDLMLLHSAFFIRAQP